MVPRLLVSDRHPFVLLLLSALAMPCLGREIFHLSTGFALEAKSHAQVEGKLVLTTASGTVELPIVDVTRIEYLADPQIPQTPPLKIDRPRSSPADLLRAAAASQGDAPEFLRFVQSVAWVESGLRANVVSPKGAVGLMQLMPATARVLGVSPDDPKQNAEGGARYLRQLLEQYRNDSVLALAAYNAGPGAVQRFGGIPPYAETRQYIKRVLREYAKTTAPKQLEASERSTSLVAVSGPSAVKSLGRKNLPWR
jgi:hypothetical protein